MWFLRWNFSIQAKITLFIIVVVVSVLHISTYFSRMLTEEKAEENLKERYVNIVKQIDAGIATLQELRDTSTLEEELAKLLQVTPDIERIEVFELGNQGVHISARSGLTINHPVPLSDSDEIEPVRRGEVITHLETSGADRFWNILAPIRIKKEVVGLIRARISTKEFDSLVVQERQQAFLVTTTAALAILVFLLLYLRRTISQPIRSLVHAMARAENGDLENPVKIKSQDELGRLARQFNQMLSKIKENTERVRNFNEELQLKVRQATSELNRRYEELMEINRQLSETQLQLAHSERLAAAGQVAANVAHRIGTPLHSILGHLYRLKRDTSSLRHEERIKIIESQVQRVVQVIQELLDTVRKPAVTMEQVHVDKLIEDVLNLSMPGFSVHGIKVRTQYEPQLSAIAGNARQLHEVFLNLFSNAMDAMPSGGELLVSVGIQESDVEMMAVVVKDTGCGIGKAEIPKIFEPFFTTKDKGKGTGLGLSICREIVKTHGGEIQVSSHIGIGTTIAITLPMNRHEAA